MIERDKERLLFLILLVFVAGTSAITKRVLLRSKNDCYTNGVHVLGENISRYRVSLSISRYDCSPDVTGFSCSQDFRREADSFANIGKRLCVDIHNIQDGIGSSKLIYTVSDKDDILKKIDSASVLSSKSPYYVCTTSDSDMIKVSITVQQDEYICPDILNYMFDNVIEMGTVMSVPQSLIVKVKMDPCFMEPLPDVDIDSLLIKVYAAGAIGRCNLVKRLPQSFSYVRVCLKVEFYSPDFECPVMIRIHSEDNDDDDLSLVLSRKPGSDKQICDTYSSHPVLSVKNYLAMQDSCKGNLAFRIDMRGTSSPDDNSDQRSPNLYMAVFITLIAICLVCLALTCLCCIRFRAKRLRRLQQRSNRRRDSVDSIPNHGFQLDGPNPIDNPISWSPSQPGMLFGLPSYDDVVGGNGVNPSDDSRKDDLPPTYDSVFGSSET